MRKKGKTRKQRKDRKKQFENRENREKEKKRKKSSKREEQSQKHYMVSDSLCPSRFIKIEFTIWFIVIGQRPRGI